MVFQPLRFQSTQHAVAVLSEASQVAVELLVPVRKSAELRQMLDLIDIARSHTAAVRFLQRHEIVVGEQVADSL